MLTGTVLGLVFAYVVRFHALALSASSRAGAHRPKLDEAARSLGADRRVLSEVHLPLMYRGS